MTLPRSSLPLLLAACAALAAGPADAQQSWFAAQRAQMRFDGAMKQAHAAVVRDDYTNAAVHLRAALAAQPANPEARLMLLRACDRLGRFDEGLALADGLVRDHPGLEEPWFTRAYLAARAGQSGREAAAWEALLARLPPDHPKRREVYASLVPLLARLGRADQAVRLGRDWAAAGGADRDQLRFLIGLELELGHDPQALALIEKALAGKPDPAARLALKSLRLDALHRLGRHEDALAAAAELARDTGDPQRLFDAASAARLLGRNEEALRLYRESLGRRFTPQAALDSFYLLKKEGRAAEGRDTLDQLAALTNAPPDARRAALYELAQLHLAAGRPADYDRAMTELLRQSPEPDMLYEYAARLLDRGLDTEALAAFEQAHEKETNPDRRRELALLIANLRLARKEFAPAVAWLQKARPSGGNEAAWHAAMARALYGQDKFADALDHLLLIPNPDDDTCWLLGMALSRLNRPGLALHYLERVAPARLPTREERAALHANRAFLRFNQDLYDAALGDFDAALALRRDPPLLAARLRTLARLNPGAVIAEAPPLLDELAAAKAPAGLRAEVLETRGLCQLQEGRLEEAEDSFTQALELDPGRTAVLYPRGLARFRQGDTRHALEDLRAFRAATPSPPAPFFGDLGVAEGRDRDFDQGVTNMQRLLAFYPFDLNSREELGYQAMKANQGRLSRAAFRQAIEDYERILPLLAEPEAKAYRREQLLLKEEYTKLDKSFGVQAYATRTDLDEDLAAGAPDTIDSAIASQAGLVGLWRPPLAGFRNEKTLDVFGRVLANFQRRSLSLDSDSYQAGFGLLYKPLADYNFNVSLERLVKIGDNAEDNWLWRNMLSLERGERVPLDRPLWFSGRLYGEAAFYLEDVRRWVAYLDGRAGPALGLGSHFALTLPQVLAIGRYQSNDADAIGTYGIVGLGASLRALEGERRLTKDRFYVDLYGHYVRGRFAERPDSFDEPDFEGWVFGIALVK